MAWIRTSTALIAFGFTIYQFLEHRIAAHHRTVGSPRVVGLLMITTGLICLVLAVYSERKEMAALREDDPTVRGTMTIAVAATIAVFGFLALVIVAVRR